MQIRLIRLGLLCCMLFLSTVTPRQVNASDRCVGVKQEVRKAHYQYFGTDFPSHYSVSQLKQESGCRDVISRDGVGSEGMPQITFSVWKSALKHQGITEIKTHKNQFRAQAFINKCAYDEAKYKKLWVMYQVYNGGGLVNQEIERAGKVDWAAARKACRRKIVHYKDGSSENACDINYQYSKHIFKFADMYRDSEDGREYPYW